MKLSIEDAISISNKGYKLLRWLENALQEQFLSEESVGEFLSTPIVALAWIKNNYHNLPENGRPENLNSESLTAFSNLVGTYLHTSHRIIKEPGTRYVPSSLRGEGNANKKNAYIVPIRLSQKDKQKADSLKREVLVELLESKNKTNSDIESIFNDENTFTAISYLTYVDCLKKRIKGNHFGGAHLALWREIAWEKKGSPKPKFEFSEEGYYKSLKIVESKMTTYP